MQNPTDDIESLLTQLDRSNVTAKQQTMVRLRDIADSRAVQPLIKLLNHEHPQIRELAVKVLVSLGDRRAVKPLMQLANDSSKWVRSELVLCLGRWKIAEAIPLIVNALGDHEWEVRQSAALACEWIKNVEVVPALLPLLYDQVTSVAGFASEALGQLRSPDAVEPLLAAFKANLQRTDVVFALGEIKDKRAAEPLLQAFDKAGPDVQEAILFALGKIGDGQAFKTIVSALKTRLAPTAALALGYLGNTPAIELLIPLLHSNDYWLRISATRALGLLKDARAVNPLIESLSDREHPISREPVWRACVSALREIGTSEALAALEMWAVNHIDDRQMRIDAMWTLHHLHSKYAVDSFSTLLDDASIRSFAIELLGLQGNPLVIKAILRFVEDADDEVRCNIATAFGRLNVLEMADILFRLLSDSSRCVRREATLALGMFNDQRAIIPLIGLLTDRTVDLPRRAEPACEVAAAYLQRIGTPEAINALEKWRLSLQNLG